MYLPELVGPLSCRAQIPKVDLISEIRTLAECFRISHIFHTLQATFTQCLPSAIVDGCGAVPLPFASEDKDSPGVWFGPVDITEVYANV